MLSNFTIYDPTADMLASTNHNRTKDLALVPTQTANRAGTATDPEGGEVC